MTETDQQAASPHGRPRTWLGYTLPKQIEYDDWITYVDWGSEVDLGIAGLRATDAALYALFRIAESDGLAIIPVWPVETGQPHPLMELALTTVDTDWIMVCGTDLWRASFTADMIIDPLAPANYARHRTPMWTVYITGH